MNLKKGRKTHSPHCGQRCRHVATTTAATWSRRCQSEPSPLPHARRALASWSSGAWPSCHAQLGARPVCWAAMPSPRWGRKRDMGERLGEFEGEIVRNFGELWGSISWRILREAFRGWLGMKKRGGVISSVLMHKQSCIIICDTLQPSSFSHRMSSHNTILNQNFSHRSLYDIQTFPLHYL